MFGLLIATVVGIFAGIFTGITPGLHINLVAAVAQEFSDNIWISPLFLAVAIVAMSITHTFLDFIPSVFLGAPDSDTALAALPGHRMLLKGRAYEAIKLTAIGGVCSLAITVAALPILIKIVPLIYRLAKPHLSLILSVFVVLLILKEGKLKLMLFALLVFMLSGALGMLVWDSGINQSLFHMLSGLFGVSMLVISIRSKTNIPKQTERTELVSKKSVLVSSLLAFLSGGLVSIFPGIGPAQAAALVSVKKMKAREYMMTVGGINTVSMLFALITTHTINKARNGSIAVVQQLVNVDLRTLLLFALISAIAAAASFFLVLKTAKIAAAILQRITYWKVCLAVILLVFSLSFFFAGFIGIAVLSSATLIGILPSITGVNRSHLMGCLLLPVVVYFL